MEEHDLLARCWAPAVADARSGTDALGALPVAERIRAVARAGFSGIGLGLEDLHETRVTIGLEALRRVLDDVGLVWVQLGTLEDWWTTGDRRALSDLDRMVVLEAAAALGAAQIVVAADTTTPMTSPTTMADDWLALAAQAEQVGAQVVLSAAPTSNLGTTERAARFVQQAGHPNGGLVLDIAHAVAGGSTVASLRAAIDPAFLFAVELSDAAGPDSVSTRAGDRRALPGGGLGDLPAFVHVARELGHGEPWGVEVRTAVTDGMSAADALRTAAAASRAVLDAADAIGAPAAPPMPSSSAPASAVDADLPYTPI
ncbi:sugar phosphate isomerase/epimerase [Curtobacterium sp. MCBD17_013]|uniref:sugar phosphate isomerase/epimerase family protein n=1 Tax=unclassified Curtobacterium TaxID=257496 RepID=UPI000DA761AB|nr:MULTISPECIES: sugar phosphate isomerase/epimerase [unclassified Curtobacterium]PZE76165.1 sugar phosphate isomerase/epimerase [Curtobacterium sp. MCBD17_019]PZF61785.1 sugar phosphate isomerase/epimerase [Curtobacterium sp. MCBD17_013]WIE54394.1 sugar phosphate isomerase/epimerase [Curtobacterium sp. MCBD17_003]